jgi:hypothetical protein
MQAKGPRSIAELLHSGDIAGLQREAATRREFVEELRLLLPADEAGHLVAASTDAAGRLVLSMDSAAWAARVRFRATELGHANIRVRVVPAPDQSGKPGAS